MLAALVRALAQAGGRGGGGALLVQLCKDAPGVLRLAVGCLLGGLTAEPPLEPREAEAAELRAQLLLRLLAAPSATGASVDLVLSAVLDAAAARDPPAADEAPRPPPRLKRLAALLVRASHGPRALAWLQTNRARWVWLQSAVRERTAPAGAGPGGRSDSSAMLITDLEEMAESTAAAGVRVQGAGEPLANGPYRLMRHPVSGAMQFVRLVGDLECAVARGSAAHAARGGWVIRSGQTVRPPPPPSRTKWTRLVHPSVLIGHAPRAGAGDRTAR